MKTILRVVTFLLGSIAISAVMWLGYQTAINQSPQLVAIFGVAAAIAAPLGFILIGYAFQSNDQETIKRLAKVPEIERLINEAKSQEEKIRLLEQQKSQLSDIVMFEVRRQALTVRKESLEKEGIRVLDELRAIAEELYSLNAQVNIDGAVKTELEQLRQRIEARQRGDIIFSLGRRSLILEGDIIRNLPWPWYILFYEILRMLSHVVDELSSQLKKRESRKNRKNSAR
jgi:hypothetical protein